MIMGANVASILLMLLVGYSDHLNPQAHPLLSCLGLAFPALLAINVCFLVFWAIFSLKRVIVPILGFLLCYVPVRTYFPLNLGPSEKADLKVISYNVAGYSADEDGVRGGGLKGALDYVASCDADVACLQEVTLREKEKERVGNRFPHVSSQYLRYSGSGVTLLSKYPIRKKELIENFISSVNADTDVDQSWRDYVQQQKEEDLKELIETENLKPEETTKFIESSFRDGQVRTTGTDIDKILPPMSRFGGGNRQEKKKTVIQKIQTFFERYFGL